MTQRERFAWVAEQYLGNWYKWAGDDPSGFDCSGLVVECGKSVGLFPRRYDASAKQIYADLRERLLPQVADPRRGDLVFWATRGAPDTIFHVEIVVDDGPPTLSIGASGGGPTTLSLADAVRDSAFIKIRSLDSRHGHRYALDPFCGKP